MAAALHWWGEPVRRRCAKWRRDPAAQLAVADTPYRRLLGEARWQQLPEATRNRFARHVGAHACVAYVGEVVECRMRWPGWVLAQFARLAGAPLPLSRDTGVAASVSVTGTADGQGQYWMRQYGRRGRFPQVIHSCKRFAGPTGLEEYLGVGIGIALTLDAVDGSLLFLSDRYFVEVASLRLRLPAWLAPGRLVIGHVDLGEGRFAFTLDLIHPWLGELIHQLVVFADQEGAVS